MLRDQGFSLAMVRHLFLPFHVRVMVVIIRGEDRPQIEPKGERASMRSLIWDAASYDISVIHGAV